MLINGDGTTDAYSQYDAGDNLQTLTQSYTGGSGVTFSYGWQKNHQRASTSVSNGAFAFVPFTGTTTYGTPDPNNGYTSANAGSGNVSFTYDGNRNLTFDGSNTLTYDVENRLVQAQNLITSSQYLYDPLGNRKQKQVQMGGGTTTTQFLTPGGEEIADYNCYSATCTPWVLTVRGPGGLPVAAITPATGSQAETVVFYHHDVMGSTVASTTAGLNGAAEAYVYSDFGAPAGGSYLAYQFAGYRYDSETGLYYVHARYYNPNLGRFLQTDPIGTQGGNNLYAYVNNDPINLFDPLGLCAEQMGPLGGSPQLSYTTTGNVAPVSANPDGSYNYQSSLDVVWNVSTSNMNVSISSAGQIIQQVTMTSSTGTQVANYWESWNVSAQGVVTPTTGMINGTIPGISSNTNDVFMAPSGTIITSTAVFYPGYQVPTAGPGAFIPDNPATFGGGLPSSTVNPNPPSPINSSPPVNRTWSAP